MAWDASAMFYTKEELDALTIKDNMEFKAQSFWYNFTEDILCWLERFK